MPGTSNMTGFLPVNKFDSVFIDGFRTSEISYQIVLDNAQAILDIQEGEATTSDNITDLSDFAQALPVEDSKKLTDTLNLRDINIANINDNLIPTIDQQIAELNALISSLNIFERQSKRINDFPDVALAGAVDQRVQISFPAFTLAKEEPFFVGITSGADDFIKLLVDLSELSYRGILTLTGLTNNKDYSVILEIETEFDGNFEFVIETENAGNQTEVVLEFDGSITDDEIEDLIGADISFEQAKIRYFIEATGAWILTPDPSALNNYLSFTMETEDRVGISVILAAGVSYVNATSGLDADNVQDAIDELAPKLFDTDLSSEIDLTPFILGEYSIEAILKSGVSASATLITTILGYLANSYKSFLAPTSNANSHAIISIKNTSSGTRRKSSLYITEGKHAIMEQIIRSTAVSNASDIRTDFSKDSLLIEGLPPGFIIRISKL